MSLVHKHRDRLCQLHKQINAPFFYYDLDHLQTHIQSLKPWPAKLFYAVKANPLSSIIQTLNNNDMGFDVASIGELEQVLAQGVDADKIIHTGPAKSRQQLTYFLDKGVTTFVVESHTQFHILSALSQEKQISVKVLLRVQLKWSDKRQNVLGGGQSMTPFGLPLEDWYAVLNTRQANTCFEIIGFHCFQWGNIIDSGELKTIWQSISRQLIEFSQAIGFIPQVIDLGGGLGVPYEGQTHSLDRQEIAKILETLQKDYPTTEFWLELGRYAVADSGLYTCEITDRKSVYDIDMLIVDGGVHHLLRPVLTDQAFPTTLLRDSNKRQKPFQVHGSLCTSLDRLGWFSLPEDIIIGDLITSTQTGAYGFTESMPFFLCHRLPAEVIFRHNNTHIIRQSQGAETWLC
ncbi:MAG: PLP-dependent decarboxylase [Francisellaceae bacterium]